VRRELYTYISRSIFLGRYVELLLATDFVEAADEILGADTVALGAARFERSHSRRTRACPDANLSLARSKPNFHDMVSLPPRSHQIAPDRPWYPRNDCGNTESVT